MHTSAQKSFPVPFRSLFMPVAPMPDLNKRNTRYEKSPQHPLPKPILAFMFPLLHLNTPTQCFQIAVRPLQYKMPQGHEALGQCEPLPTWTSLAGPQTAIATVLLDLVTVYSGKGSSSSSSSSWKRKTFPNSSTSRTSSGSVALSFSSKLSGGSL